HTNNSAAMPSIAYPTVVPSRIAFSRCPFLYPNGKRCSLSGLQIHSGFYLGHSQTIVPALLPVNRQDDSEDLTAELLPELEFNSGVDISKFLARLLRLVTKGAISPRRASVLSYIANQLLHPPRRRSQQTLQDPPWYRRALEAATRDQGNTPR